MGLDELPKSLVFYESIGDAKVVNLIVTVRNFGFYAFDLHFIESPVAH